MALLTDGYMVTHVSTVPRTYEELLAIDDDLARIVATGAYIDAGEEKLRLARQLRDQAILRLIAERGPSETARITGLSLSTIKIVKRNAP